MSGEMQQDDGIYEVVINDEEQYSIWAADKAVPVGWRKVAGPEENLPRAYQKSMGRHATIVAKA